MDLNALFLECNLRAHVQQLVAETSDIPYVQVLCTCIQDNVAQNTRIFVQTKHVTAAHWMLLFLMQQSPTLRLKRTAGLPVQRVFLHAFISWAVPALRLSEDVAGLFTVLPVAEGHCMDDMCFCWNYPVKIVL
jgi:hypothetical protein